VLIDDGSTDGTAASIGRAFPEVRVVILERNQGPAAARNRGLAEARAPLIAFLDADDLWKPDYLRAMADELRDPRVAIAFSNVERIDARGRVTVRRALRKIPPAPYPMPVASASVVRASALRRVDGFDPAFSRYFENVDLFTKLALRFGREGFRFVDRPLVSYRRHPAQLTSLIPRARAWSRRTGPVGDEARRALLDLAHLGSKHRSWMLRLPAGSRRPSQPTLEEAGCGFFELALRRGRGRT
jgi:glycosyltransferase involved in cell wall biosynthesis